MRRAWFLSAMMLWPISAWSAERAPTAAPARQEYRFDALRIDGTLHGPEAVVVRTSVQRTSSPIFRPRCNFLRRILETVETPALHRGP